MRSFLLRFFSFFLVSIAVFFILNSVLHDFTIFEYTKFNIEEYMVSNENVIASTISFTMWEQRYFDTVVLALLLFVSSACCATILTQSRGKSF
jgi:hypothetical protein